MIKQAFLKKTETVCGVLFIIKTGNRQHYYPDYLKMCNSSLAELTKGIKARFQTPEGTTALLPERNFSSYRNILFHPIEESFDRHTYLLQGYANDTIMKKNFLKLFVMLLYVRLQAG